MSRSLHESLRPHESPNVNDGKTLKFLKATFPLSGAKQKHLKADYLVLGAHLECSLRAHPSHAVNVQVDAEDVARTLESSPATVAKSQKRLEGFGLLVPATGTTYILSPTAFALIQKHRTLQTGNSTES